MPFLIADATTLWPLALPLLLGAAAVFLLLPRPEPYPPAAGAGLGALALLVGGVLIVRVGLVDVEALLFYVFSTVALVAGGLLLTQRNPARAALSFTLVILSTCGLFLLLAAPFLMAATITVYAGAIVVTFLFVLMLAQQAGLSDADARSREPALATLTGFVLLGGLLFVLQGAFRTDDVDKLRERVRRAAALDDAAAIREAVGADEELFQEHQEMLQKKGFVDLFERVRKLRENVWLGLAATGDVAGMKRALADLEAIDLEARSRVGFRSPDPLQPTTRPWVGLQQAPPLPATAQRERTSALSGPTAVVPPGELRRDEQGRPFLPAENAAHLGTSLFTDYLLPVELGGLLLLTATVGAIAIAQRYQTGRAP
jgi:NADH:ubiquinone oxidoreductase subunit 6 (subunit J)